MENYIMINGKKIEISEETAKNIEEQFMPKKKSIFDRVELGCSYFTMDDNGECFLTEEYDWKIDSKRHDMINYCTDKEYLQNRTERELLNRKLEKFSLENGGDEIDWEDKNQWKYCIKVTKNSGGCDILSTQGRRDIHNLGTVYFISEEVAQQAIDKFGDEIKRVYGLE